MTCCAVDRPARPTRSLLFRAASAVALATLTVAAVAFLPLGCASTDTPAGAAPLPALQVERLINPALAPELSQWLVGPIAVLASEEEEQAFMALRDDAEAEAFIETFWAQRDPYPQRPDNPLRDTFDQRAAVANRLYSEGGRSGVHTARGTIYVIYGKPGRTDYEIAEDPRDPPVEAWFYSGEQETGLDGEPPGPRYRFIKRGAVTTFYTPLLGVDRARPVRPGRF